MGRELVTWRKLMTEALEERGEVWSDILSYYPSDLDWDKPFDDDYGGTEGVPFHAWTANRVYFCVCYDGAEWVSSVPRSFSLEDPKHHGGG